MKTILRYFFCLLIAMIIVITSTAFYFAATGMIEALGKGDLPAAESCFVVLTIILASALHTYWRK